MEAQRDCTSDVRYWSLPGSPSLRKMPILDKVRPLLTISAEVVGASPAGILTGLIIVCPLFPVDSSAVADT